MSVRECGESGTLEANASAHRSVTYDRCEDHSHEFIVDLLFSHSVEVQAGLVGEENSVLTLDHCGSNAKEDDSDQRGEPAAIAATSRHNCFLVDSSLYYNRYLIE